MANNRKQSEIFSVPCFAVNATLPQNNPLQIFRCCGRYVYEAIGKTPSGSSMVLRFGGINTIGITFAVSQGYNKKDGQVQDFMGAINCGLLPHRLVYYNYSSSWLRLRNAP